MKTIETVLVTIMNNKDDWRILNDEKWYRIPVASAPPIIRNKNAKYLAFYHTTKFDASLKPKFK